ncbi:unnamed protein product, partial [Brenthis ino]
MLSLVLLGCVCFGTLVSCTGPGSCTGAGACSGQGSGSGTGTCTGANSCSGVKSGGGQRSCTAESSCSGEESGSGIGSCTGATSCGGPKSGGGTGSCTGAGSCKGAQSGGGTGSCTGEGSCRGARSGGGTGSCTGAGSCSTPDSVGLISFVVLFMAILVSPESAFPMFLSSEDPLDSSSHCVIILSAILLVCMIQLMHCDDEKSQPSKNENNSTSSVSSIDSIIQNIGQIIIISSVNMIICITQSLACGKVKREVPRESPTEEAELKLKEARTFINYFRLLCSLSELPGVDIFMKSVDKVKSDNGPSNLLSIY